MAEQVGTLLWEWRTAGGWTLGRLAKQAGVDKSALSRWESGARQPRVTELEAVLAALAVSPAQCALAFARIEAPRALRRLRQVAAGDGLGAPPTAGDLLRAMRTRRGWTQAQVATLIGAGQAAVARWEQGERLPSTEQFQALCCALGAREEEFIALTTGRFSEAPADEPTTWREAEPRLRLRLRDLRFRGNDVLADLRYVALERQLWVWAAHEEGARPLLAHTYGFHAQHCRNQRRWSQAAPLAQRALDLTPRQEIEPDPILRAALSAAAAAVYAGHRPSPERGMRRLQPWLARSAQLEMTAWMQSDLAEYLVLDRQTEAGLSLAEQACRTAQAYYDPVELYLRRGDYGRLLMAVGRPCDALRVLPEPGHSNPLHEADDLLTVAEAHRQAGHAAEAQDWLQRAYGHIETHGLDGLRPKAEALARRF